MSNEAAVERISTNMPALDVEMSLRGKRELGKLLGVHGIGTPRMRQIADGFVRLVEKTVLEYMASREKLVDFLKDGVYDDSFRAQDHFESCVQSLHRSIAYLDRLRSLGVRQADGQAFVPRPRDLEILRDDAKSKVRKFRDFAEHLDQDVIDGNLPPNAEVSIHLGWETATLNDAQLAYADLARWIGQLHELALRLSVVELVVGEPLAVGKGDDDA